MKHAIAFTHIPRLSPSQQLALLSRGLDVQALFERPQEELNRIGAQTTTALVTTICEKGPAILAEAEQEVNFCTEHNIQVLLYGTPNYPERLTECPDAPTILYYRGAADLNARHIVAVVGTRNATEYGKLMCARLMEDLAALLPDTLIVSGLAYGIDINAHRGAMRHGMPTVAVLAHGLDHIYPASHRNDAKQLLTTGGGLLTEFHIKTRPLPAQFLQRNRIVAGMSDAVIVVESGSHGGSLATARIALSYNRQVFAVPGRVTDEQSVGCNNLIADLKASILNDAESLVRDMGWWEDTTAYRAVPRQLSLFDDEDPPAPSALRGAKRRAHDAWAALSPDEQQLGTALEGSDGMTAEQLTAATGLTLEAVNTALFELDMEGLVKVLPGGLYIRCR